MNRPKRTRKATIQHDEDGWWAYYFPGWKAGDNPIEARHSDLGDTKAEILECVRDAVKCTCDECNEDLKNN